MAHLKQHHYVPAAGGSIHGKHSHPALKEIAEYYSQITKHTLNVTKASNTVWETKVIKQCKNESEL